MFKFITVIAIFFVSFLAKAAKVDTVTIHSNAMQKNINCVVIKPNNYKKQKSFSTVYLLHGYSGKYSDWIIQVNALKNYADEYKLLIICPDGGYSSWYFNSPIDTTYQYETHVATEVVNYIDANYKTIANASKRAITGLSMGGHGAFYLGLRHPNIFGAIGSMSGGVNLIESKNKFDVAKRIGDTSNWKNYTIVNLIEKYASTNYAIIFDCGVNDFFIEGNRLLHQKMLQLKIPHTYIEKEGEHNWEYWANAIEYQLLFFKKHFITY
jgi:S-formylglutathione hydrolase FrmB